MEINFWWWNPAKGRKAMALQSCLHWLSVHRWTFRNPTKTSQKLSRFQNQGKNFHSQLVIGDTNLQWPKSCQLNGDLLFCVEQSRNFTTIIIHSVTTKIIFNNIYRNHTSLINPKEMDFLLPWSYIYKYVELL